MVSNTCGDVCDYRRRCAPHWSPHARRGVAIGARRVCRPDKFATIFGRDARFNGSLSNKTLVLIDGRSVYDPLFSGTFWNVQDVLLEDLDRIEVIRGPGPTLWGANAVNGVINIITKSAKDTQGFFFDGGGGTYQRAFGEARYGFQLDDHSWFSVYGKWFERDHLVLPDGSSAHDDWNMWRGGFRYDLEGDNHTLFTLPPGGFVSKHKDITHVIVAIRQVAAENLAVLH